MHPESGLVLLVPGLLQPPRGVESDFDRCANLGAWLARSEWRPGPRDWEAAIAALFDLGGSELSLAALRFGAECAAVDGDWVAFADPVHLRVDPNRAILFGPQLLRLTPAESTELTLALNQHLRAESLQLVCADSGQWYLHGRPQAPLRARPLGEVVGRSAEPFLPDGEGARYWRRLLNELQMLLHAHPVNQRRQDNNQPTVSSIWPWAGGTSPVSVRTRLRAIHSDDPALQILAGLAGIDTATANIDGPVLRVVMDLQQAAEGGDVGAWSDALLALDRAWPALLRESGRGAVVELWSADGRRHSGRPWRPWRRPRWPGYANWHASLGP